MHFNGNDYPYYQVEMGDGTPCDLKKNIPRSVIIYYICNMKAHATGTVSLFALAKTLEC